MRLICPRCGAQYEIDAGAIPPAGRDVECSACDHVWRAMPEAFDPAARPQLSRPLNESVIGILREEAARELEVRAAERRTQRAAERAAAVAAEIASEPQVHLGTEGAAEAGPGKAMPGKERAVAAQAGDGNDMDESDGARREPAVEGPSGKNRSEPAGLRYPAEAARQPETRLAYSEPREPRVPVERRRYAAGFGTAVIIALVALALYALAPRLTDQGGLGATLGGWRAEVDRGRDWLSHRGSAAVGRLRGE